MNKNYTNPNTYQIMIVDDEAIVRLITRASLENYGYRVVDFGDSLEALAYYQTNWRDVDLVILDMIMPVMKGDELFYQLKKVNPFIIACVLSGSEGVENKYHHLITDGLSGFIHKPVSSETINGLIQNMLKTYQTINVDKGLSLIINNEKIYLKLLKIYLEEYGNLEHNFNDLLAQGKLNEIDNIIHKIKGIAMNLGAIQTYQMATSLHQKFHDNEFDLEELYLFIKYHHIVVKDIERILGAQSV